LADWADVRSVGNPDEKERRPAPPALAAGVHLDFALRDRRNGQRDNQSVGHAAHPGRVFSCAKSRTRKQYAEIVAFVFRGEGEKV
jgi:hypothetical protein